MGRLTCGESVMKMAIAKTQDGRFALIHPFQSKAEDAVKLLPTTTAYFFIEKAQLDMEADHPHIDATQFDWANPDGYGERLIPEPEPEAEPTPTE